MDIIHSDINCIKGRHSRPCFRRGKLVPAKGERESRKTLDSGSSPE